MAKIITFANQKGGVGKSTTAINVAASLGVKGKKVLLVDVDPQGNASSSVGVNKKNVLFSSYDILTGRASAEQVILHTPFQNLDVIPATISLAGAEPELATLEGRNYRLRDALTAVSADYDFILIDCPPSIGVLTLNALAASNGVVIPTQCEYFALEGLTQLMLTIKNVQRILNPTLELYGIVITMYNNRLNLARQAKAELYAHYSDKVFKTVIARNVRISEAPGFGMPVYYFDKYSKGSIAYSCLTEELLARV